MTVLGVILGLDAAGSERSVERERWSKGGPFGRQGFIPITGRLLTQIRNASSSLESKEMPSIRSTGGRHSERATVLPQLALFVADNVLSTSVPSSPPGPFIPWIADAVRFQRRLMAVADCGTSNLYALRPSTVISKTHWYIQLLIWISRIIPAVCPLWPPQKIEAKSTSTSRT